MGNGSIGKERRSTSKIILIFSVFLCVILFLDDYGYGKSHSRRIILNRAANRNNTRVWVPEGFSLARPALRRYYLLNYRIDCFARSFAQGEALYVELIPVSGVQSPEVLSIFFCGKRYIPVKTSWGYRCLIAIPPECKPGKKLLRIRTETGQIPAIYFNIKKSYFEFNRNPMDLGKFSDIDFRYGPDIMKMINRAKEMKKKAFSSSGEDLLNNTFSHPRDYHYVTSTFWAKRLYMRYKIRNGRKIRLKNRKKVHRGLDLRGKTGEPVYSMARGRVVLARDFFFEGKIIIIDHGNNVFSYFMHLEDILVKENQVVDSGDLIARVGSTGISTAAHLHVSLMIMGVQVSPMGLLSLPLRE